ncbi:MAG: hypothetical protein KAU21_12855, partial [Gammaproteobacteria bacterium]|nr:hypothetical protein [Gammaproteobacteria bacterium]
IFNDIQCYQVSQKKHRDKQKFRINLTYLDQKPKRDFILADGWLITAVISSILSFLLVYAGWFSNIKMSLTTISIITILTISFSFIAFLVTLLRTHDRVIFFSHYGRVPILEFINKKPDTKAFKQFIKTLRKHILQAQANSQLSVSVQLKLELKELRRLKHETVVSEAYYEKAKKLILRNKGFNAE